MSIFTEDTVRQLHLKQQCTEFSIRAGDYMTDEAKSYICDKKLSLTIAGVPAIVRGKKTPASSCGFSSGFSENEDASSFSLRSGPSYHTEDGRTLRDKPEHMTHLYGNVIVCKNHARILFRGKMDSLMARIAEIQIAPPVRKDLPLTACLDELMDLCRKILLCEVSGKPLEPGTLFSLSEEEVHEYSHHPKKTIGIGHITLSRQCGETVILLNSLRTGVRETELAAINAFLTAEGDVIRPDILRVLNRMSSAVYVLMLQTEKAVQTRSENET